MGDSFVSWLTSSSKRSQRGEGKLKAIIYTVILFAAVYAAVKIVPAYVAEYQLNDKITEQARFAVVNHYTEDQIRDIIFKVIQDLDIPPNREDIKLQNTNHGVMISGNTSVPVDFKVNHTKLNFSAS